MTRLRIGVMVSGRGTNLQAIIDAIERGELEADIAVVVSNRANVLALQRAMQHNIPSITIERKDYPNKREHHMAMAEVLKKKQVGLVVMAGFDRIMHPEFMRQFPQRVINIHPSLLPAFGGGLHAQTDALNYGVKIAGCTAHFVTEDVDAGPIVLQAAVPVLDEDTADSLAARILKQEHIILPQAIQLFAKGALRMVGRRVLITKKLER